MKIFYTTYEGGPILKKTIRSGRKRHQLVLQLEGLNKRISGPGGFGTDHVILFGQEVHSIFIPTSNNFYQRWDSINGWNETDLESRDTLVSLTKAVRHNKQKGRKTK